MGLFRTAIRIIPPVAAFALGYYIGTIDSGAYECIFEPEQRIEQSYSGLEHEVELYERSNTLHE